jgi:hypothetical protein
MGKRLIAAAAIAATVPLAACSPTSKQKDQATPCVISATGLMGMGAKITLTWGKDGAIEVLIRGGSFRPLAPPEDPREVSSPITSRTYDFRRGGSFTLTEVPDHDIEERKTVPSNYMNDAVRKQGDDIYKNCLQPNGLVPRG